MYNIFSLASQGVRRKKKSSILIFLVLLLSFSFAIASLSLVGSMSKTNAEFRLNTYGEWYFAVLSGEEADAEWLENQSWVEAVGTARVYGTVLASGKDTGLGTVDEVLKTTGRLKIDKGNWPANQNEIVMEVDTLSALGYDYTLGQEITMQVAVSCGEEPVVVERKFTLCGLLHEYTDLWLLTPNPDFMRVNGAIVTDTAANQLLEEARSKAPAEAQHLIESTPQYFISVAEENREAGLEQLSNYLIQHRTGNFSTRPCENRAAYPEGGVADYDKVYIYAIAAVALLAVLCIYIMQLPAETHSFAVLRSIGITRGQMAQLLVTESMLLCIPAVFLGIPCGLLLIRAALETAMYTGSVAVQVAVPWNALISVLCLWVVMVLVTRLLVYLVTIRTPLTGQMQMKRNNFRRAKNIRSAFIVLLVTIFGAVMIFTGMESIWPNGWRVIYSARAPYDLSAFDPDDSNRNVYLTQEQMRLIEQVPGVSYVESFGAVPIRVIFDGTEIRYSSDYSDPELKEEIINGVYLYVVDEKEWDDVIPFGNYREAFHNGETVMLCFPDTEEEFQLPQGDIQICAYKKNDTLQFISEPTPVTICRVPAGAENKGHSVTIALPYTVICSNAYMQKLLDYINSQNPGMKLNCYTAGHTLGDTYPFGQGHVNWNIADLSTDIVLAELCQKNNLFLWNERQITMAEIQGFVQTLILLYASGGCIVLMTLMILYSAMSLEAEQEKRYFKTMRIIGMSKQQMQIKIFGKAFTRGCMAVFGGWLFYFGYRAAEISLRGDSLENFIEKEIAFIQRGIWFNGYPVSYLPLLSIACLLVPLLLSLIAKRKLRRENMLS